MPNYIVNSNAQPNGEHEVHQSRVDTYRIQIIKSR